MFSNDFNFGFERCKFLKNSVYFLLQQNSIMVVSVKALIFFACLIILLWERASKFDGTAHLWKCK